MKAAAIEGSSRARWLVWLAVAALGWFLFRQLSLEWSINPQYSYGWVVPALAAYLIWERWKDRPTVEAGGINWGLFWILAGLLALVRLVQEANPDWRLVSWTAALCVTGLGWIGFAAAGGGAWSRHFAFAVGFVLVATPWPTPVENLLVQSLMRGVAGVTVEFLNWMGIAAQQEGNLIRLAGGTLGVDEACSGVRSFQGTIMAALFLGELNQLRVGRRAALAGIGVGLALVLNMARAGLLAVVAGKKGIAVVNKWHDPAGWILLGVTFLGLMAMAKWLAKGKKLEPTHVGCHRGLGGPRSLVRASVIMLFVLVGAEVGTRFWYSWHERNAVASVKWQVDWPHEWRAPVAENVRLILRFNEGESAIWDRPDGSRWHLFFFSWKPGRAAAALARSHRPETCLPSTGFELAKNRGVKIVRAGGLELPVERLEFHNGGKVWRVYYCLTEDRVSARAVESEPLTRWARIDAVLEGRRHLGQRVLEVVIGGMDSDERADAALAEALEKWIRVEKS